MGERYPSQNFCALTRTVAATVNTPFYQLHHPAVTLTLVLTLLLHVRPIVAAFGLDERTVRAGLRDAGAHAALLHDGMTVGVEAQQVQADEIRVRVCGGAMWVVIALDVGSRLWLATAGARRRDGVLIHLLRRRTLAALPNRAFLPTTASLAMSYHASIIAYAPDHRQRDDKRARTTAVLALIILSVWTAVVPIKTPGRRLGVPRPQDTAQYLYRRVHGLHDTALRRDRCLCDTICSPSTRSPPPLT